jgi:hypothetical protein
MGPGGPGSGGYGPPPAPGGGSNNTALWVVLGVLIVAALGGLVFFLTSGDDGEDSETSDRDRPGQNQPGDPPEPPDEITIPTIPDGGGSGGDDGGGRGGDDGGGSDGGAGGGDALSQATDWIYGNSPMGVDRDESACMAELVISVVGEDEVASAGGDLEQVYSGTSFDQDDEIRAGIGDCIDSASLEEWREQGMPW